MTVTRNVFFVLAALSASQFAASLSAEDWPHWRGPLQNGVAAGSGFPVKWSEEENIAWKVSLPGWGTSTPAFVGGRIFVTCADDSTNWLICLNRDGKKLWEQKLGQSAGNRNRKASGANPSPVADAQHVFAYFRSGDLACLTHDGQLVWKTNLQGRYGRDSLGWDLGTSPVLTKDFVTVAVMHRGPSYVVALSKQDGDEAWKTSRDLDAPAEANDSYTTPLVMTHEGQETLVVLGADHVTGYSTEDGVERWRYGTLNPDQQGNFRSISSPVVAGELIVAPYSRGRSLTAITQGSEPREAWHTYSSADVPTPTVHDGLIYICGDRGDITCLDGASGEERWSQRLPRSRYGFSSSPVIAAGNLYATREDGTTFVLQLGMEPELIATNELRENTYATPVFADGSVFIRTSDYLFCIRGE